MLINMPQGDLRTAFLNFSASALIDNKYKVWRA
jgi:hypothetical protein